MLIVSQNLSNFDITIPQNAVFRINLAWINALEDLKQILEKHSQHDIFLDLPLNRTKPPRNSYSISELIPLLEHYKNIKYFAISNVDNDSILDQFLPQIPSHIEIVPKIESPDGVKNIESIVAKLPYENKTVMLDHDDLFSSLKKRGEPESEFVKYIDELINFCNTKNVQLLRTVGVIFSDSEKRITCLLYTSPSPRD